MKVTSLLLSSDVTFIVYLFFAFISISNTNKHPHCYLKIDMQANWDEKYLTQVGYFSHVNAG